VDRQIETATQSNNVATDWLGCWRVRLIFAIFYRLQLRGSGAGDALVAALLVFGTVGFPEDAKPIAGFQVAIDFMLLAVFLAHFVGGLGSRGSEGSAS
jgi:hypothetical protein